MEPLLFTQAAKLLIYIYVQYFAQYCYAQGPNMYHVAFYGSCKLCYVRT